jgi:hypothetical protein
MDPHEMPMVMAGRLGGTFRTGGLAIPRESEAGAFEIGPGGPVLPTYAWLTTALSARHFTTIDRRFDTFELADRIARRSASNSCPASSVWPPPKSSHAVRP